MKRSVLDFFDLADRLLRRWSQWHIHDDPEVRSIPVLILSGIKQVVDFPYDYQPDSTWMPVRAFLDKPIKPDKLLAEIEKVIGKPD